MIDVFIYAYYVLLPLFFWIYLFTSYIMITFFPRLGVRS